MVLCTGDDGKEHAAGRRARLPQRLTLNPGVADISVTQRTRTARARVVAEAGSDALRSVGARRSGRCDGVQKEWRRAARGAPPDGFGRSRRREGAAVGDLARTPRIPTVGECARPRGEQLGSVLSAVHLNCARGARWCKMVPARQYVRDIVTSV